MITEASVKQRELVKIQHMETCLTTKHKIVAKIVIQKAIMQHHWLIVVTPLISHNQFKTLNSSTMYKTITMEYTNIAPPLQPPTIIIMLMLIT